MRALRFHAVDAMLGSHSVSSFFSVPSRVAPSGHIESLSSPRSAWQADTVGGGGAGRRSKSDGRAYLWMCVLRKGEGVGRRRCLVVRRGRWYSIRSMCGRREMECEVRGGKGLSAPAGKENVSDRLASLRDS